MTTLTLALGRVGGRLCKGLPPHKDPGLAASLLILLFPSVGIRVPPPIFLHVPTPVPITAVADGELLERVRPPPAASEDVHLRGGKIKAESLVGRQLESSRRGWGPGKGQRRLQRGWGRRRRFEFRKCSLRVRVWQSRAGGRRVRGARFQGGEGTEQDSFRRVPQAKQGGSGWARAPPAEERRRRIRGAPGAGALGATPHEDGRGCEAAGVRYLRSQAGEAGAGLGPGAAQRLPQEGHLPGTSGYYFPTLSLSIYKWRHGTFLQPKIRPEPGSARGLPQHRRLGGCLVGSGFQTLAGSSLGRPPPAPVAGAAQPPSTLGRSALAPRRIPSEPPPPKRPLPTPRPRSPRSPQAAPHPPRGRVSASAPPGRTPPQPLYLGLSKLHPLRRSAALFCRRSAAAAPPGSGSIAPGGGRGLGRTRVGSGLGGARRAARLARRSPCPAPRTSAGPRPRPCPTPNFSPAHSVTGSRVQIPPRPRPEFQPHPPVLLNQV